LLLAYLTLVFGELAPKRVALQKAERWGLVMARPLSLLSKITRPIVWFLSKSTDVAVRILGGDPTRQREEVTEEELREMVAAQPTFTDEQRQIMEGAFEIAERSLDEILVPRHDVYVLDASWTPEEALERLVRSGHTRAPVAPDRNLDRTVGFVHLRQLVGDHDVPLAELATDLVAFPDAARALTTLRELQSRRMQIALVVNEHGGSSGIVTVEDLVEELVGEIYDETDPDHATVRHDDDGTIVLPGRFPVHDLPDIGVALPGGDYATVAGLVLKRLGRLPNVGDTVTLDGFELEVREVRRHSIGEVAIRVVEDRADLADADDGSAADP